MSAAGRAVFLSYASQDAEAAKRICDTLRAAGVEVWFDTDGGLEHGDEWDAKIRRQIKECVLFIAIVSVHTQAREEGYFRIEWELAAQRAMGIASGVAFILPVVIDDTKESAALVPDRFRSVQWTRLPDGSVPADVLQRFLKLWSHRTGAVKHQREEQGAGSKEQGVESTELDTGRPRPAASGRRWLRPILASAAIVIAVVAFILIARRAPDRAVVPPAVLVPGPAPAATPLSPARQMVAQALAIVNSSADKSGAQLEMAAELCLRAQALDPADAETWAAGARIDALVYMLRFDGSEERRQRAQQAAAKALALAPDSKEARWAQATVLTHVVGTPDILPEAERIYRELLRQSPDDKGLLGELASVLRVEGRVDEAASLYEKIGSPIQAGWTYFSNGRFADAGKVADRMLATERSYPALYLKAHVELLGFEDPTAAEKTFNEFPRKELMAENGAAIALLVGMHRRDPDLIIRTMSTFPRDFLTKTGFDGPKRFWTGVAHEMAGHPAAARAEWTLALQQVLDRRKDKSGDTNLLLNEAMLRARLGQTEEAERVLGIYLNLIPGGRGGIFTSSILIRLGRKEEALATLAAGLQAKDSGWEIMHANLRYWADFDPLRGDPRFEKLLRDNLPPDARPFDDPKLTVTAPAADAKSVAVLAFANLSDDKANEYFSDGISEELLTVLQKIPGLRVAARTSAFSFKGSNATAQEIGAKLGVATLVEGSVRKAGNSVRITARLSRAATGEQLWSESYTRDLKDVFAVQSELAQTIVGQLHGQLGGTGAQAEIQAQVRAAEKGGTRNADAHQLYLQGKYLVNRNSYDDAVKAIALLQRAVEVDPKFALAWAALSNAGFVRGAYGNNRRDFEEGYALARRAADQAIALEPGLPAGYLARLDIQSSTDFDWKGAKESLRRAQELAPNDPAVIFRSAQLVYGFGDREEGIELIRQAVALDPVNAAVYLSQGYIFVSAGRFAEAETTFRQLLDIRTDTTWGYAGLAMVMVARGDFDQAASTVLQQAPGWSRLYIQSLALWGQKKRVESDAALAQLIKEYEDVSAYQIACAYAFRGDADRAFEWLERSYQQKDPGLSWARPDFFLVPLHTDPRWDALMRRLGLADDQLK